MLKDRLDLMEKEVEKQMSKCAQMYREVAILGKKEKEKEYQLELSNLMKMREEIKLIEKMIEEGNP